MRRYGASAVAGASALALLLGPALTGPAAGAARPEGTIAWSACTDAYLEEAAAECGTVTVPLDYAKPTGAKVTLAVSRVRSARENVRQGVLVGNPGGPGAPGLAMSATLTGAVPGARQYDTIGFDVRGTGESRPLLRCTYPALTGPAPDYRLRGGPGSKVAANEHRWLTISAAVSKDCADTGPLLAHMTFRDLARDVEEIRKALGEERISWYGVSAGTHLGAVYASMFPGRTAKLVLHSAVDPRHVWYGNQRQQSVASDLVLRQMFRWMAKRNSIYHLGGTRSTVEAAYVAELDRLARHPVGRIGPAEWADVFLGVHTEASWADAAAAWADWRAGRRGPMRGLAAIHANAYGAIHAAYLAIQCSDAPWPRAYATWRRDAFRFAVKAPHAWWQNMWFNGPCLTWPVRGGTPVRVAGDPKLQVLVLNSQFDVATPLAGALEVRARFGNARLVEQLGESVHGIGMLQNLCVLGAVADFLWEGRLPARRAGRTADKTCKPEPAFF